MSKYIQWKVILISLVGFTLANFVGTASFKFLMFFGDHEVQSVPLVRAFLPFFHGGLIGYFAVKINESWLNSLYEKNNKFTYNKYTFINNIFLPTVIVLINFYYAHIWIFTLGFSPDWSNYIVVTVSYLIFVIGSFLNFLGNIKSEELYKDYL